jgi:Uma2 family endonuclease
MGGSKSTRRYTVEEYYDLEEKEVYKSEFHAGKIDAMAGGSPAHSLIVANLLRELGNRLKGKIGTPYDGNLRIQVPATGLVTYPDASVFCKDLEFDAKDKRQQTAVNPTLVFEVLSKSTESYDRGKKLKTTASWNRSKPMFSSLKRILTSSCTNCMGTDFGF